MHCVNTFEDHRAPVNAMCFSSDGAYLASGGDDHHIYIYKLSTNKTNAGYGRHLQKLSPQQGQITILKWICYPASTGTYFFVSGGADGTMVLWKKGENETYFDSIAVKLVSFRLAIEDIDIYDRKLAVVTDAGVYTYTIALDATASEHLLTSLGQQCLTISRIRAEHG
ncbi:hypothetical protein FA13DRAFT_1795162 [Coprinellus micaceus]|uniref:Uncharacterized protein n=1 Tax=Coprinellus micaceus TaxID=71717 RepID=A0A4Y7SYI1_COPMI|nr:hypothetical protein FA13DRAFT_1795162 [Coprinellus micaceus]